jgi:hypothetical protein
MAENSQHAAEVVEQAVEQESAAENVVANANAVSAEAPVVLGDSEQQQQQQQPSEEQGQQQQYSYEQQQYYEQQQQQYQQQQQQSSDPPSAADLERIKLFVGNFPPNITDLDLGAMCGQFAQIAGKLVCPVIVVATAQAASLPSSAVSDARRRSRCSGRQSHRHEQRLRVCVRHRQVLRRERD